MESNRVVTILGAGFIGRYVVKHLDKKGLRSIVLSRNPFKKNYILTQGRTGYVDIVKIDVEGYENKILSNLKTAILSRIGCIYAETADDQKISGFSSKSNNGLTGYYRI